MNESILIVEDEEIIARELSLIVEREGYRTAGIVGTGREAAAAAEELKPDLILMDISLQGDMDGVDAAVAIMDPLGIPVIFITGRTDPHIVERIKKTGAYGYIGKPFRKMEVSIAVAMSLQRRRLEKQLAASEKRYRNTIMSIPDIVYTLDRRCNIISINKGDDFLGKYGYSTENIIGVPFTDLIYSEDRQMVTESFLQAVNTHREHTRGLEFRIMAKDRSIQWYELHSHMSFDASGAYDHEEGVLRDITEKKMLQAELEKNATYDSLTGLYNRRCGLMLLDKQAQIARRSNRSLTICYFDIDNLKTVNDNCGHSEGDRLIERTAEMLKGIFRSSDILMRMGGDEFLAVMTDYDFDDTCRIIRKRLSDRLTEEGAGGETPYRLSVSAGFARYNPGSNMTIDRLIEIADREMYKDKRGKR
ncbi:MAG: diguanylate cyclase [Spirochaetes bacterium]|nr:diguanylate cyclase [Spirochaetota bacterium]